MKSPVSSETSPTKNRCWPSDRAATVLKKAAFAGIALATLLAVKTLLEAQAAKSTVGTVQVSDKGPKPFSRQWLETFKRGVPGCLDPPTEGYSWRIAGWGSNFNTLVLKWAGAVASGRPDFGIVFDSNWSWFEQTTCKEASGGVETIGGWHCLFQQMPHLRIHNNRQEWEAGLTPLSSEEKEARPKLDGGYLQRSLRGTGLNDMKAIAMLLDHIYSHFQPWFEDAVSAIFSEPSIATLRQGKFVGVHIRRTDKLIEEAKKTETVEYFKAAAKYLDETVHGPAVTDISGVWLSSDDAAVLAEVQEIAPLYFPKIDPEKILFISDRVHVANNTSNDWDVLLKGAQSRNGYDAVVLLMAELRMLARADVFSGTFSSNVGRMVVLMRQSLDKPERSAVAADKKRWVSG